MKTNYGKLFRWGVVVWLVNSLCGNLLYMNPIVSGLYKQFAGHPTIKSMETFGGLGIWLGLTMVFGILFTAFLIWLYSFVQPVLPGKGWQNGMAFGIVIGAIKAVPEAFNQWMLFVYPGQLTLMQLFNTIFALVIFGTFMGWLFERTGVFQKEGGRP